LAELVVALTNALTLFLSVLVVKYRQLCSNLTLKHFQIWFTLMQNYIEKVHISYFFLRKTQIKNHVSPFSTFISTKRTKNRISPNCANVC